MRLKTLEVLSEDELKRIHEASLLILSKTGMKIRSRRALELLGDSGASVDMQKQQVKIPEEMVEHALRSVPSKVALYGRDGESTVVLGGEQRYAASGHNAIFVLDAETGERRSATKQDVADFARIADALDNISMVGIQVMPQDVKPEASLLHAADAVFNNTTKHLYFSTESPRVAAAIVDIARTICGRDDLSVHPILTCQLSPTSPLTWEKGAVEALMETVQAGVPCSLLPEPFSGVTSPITLAGTVALHNAEALSGVLIAQLVRKGAPLIYGTAWTTFDMREANVLIGSPEAGLMRIAGAQLARFYHIPSHTISPDSDAHCHDEQNAWERMFTSLCALSAGVNLIVNAGMFATGLTVSLEQLVLDNEMLGILFRMLRGIEVEAETIATEAIHQAGPGGNFLTAEHTLRHLRGGEHWPAEISNRCGYDQWVERGSPDVVAKARAKAQQILGAHQPKELSNQAQQQISKIIRAFEAE